jgi:hypothetical protein
MALVHQGSRHMAVSTTRRGGYDRMAIALHWLVALHVLAAAP